MFALAFILQPRRLHGALDPAEGLLYPQTLVLALLYWISKIAIAFFAARRDRPLQRRYRLQVQSVAHSMYIWSIRAIGR